MSCAPDRFPVLGDGVTRRGYGDSPSLTVPFSVVKAHEAQALKNHGQTVERLRERGGLSWTELAAVLANRKWERMSLDDAHEAVMRVVTHPAAPSADKLRIAVEALEKAKNQWDPPLTAPHTTCEAGGTMDPVTGWLSSMMVLAFGIRSSGGRLKRMVDVILAAEALAALQSERKGGM